MDRFNSLFVFLLLSFFAVSVSTIVSPDHVVVSTSTHRNSTASSSEEEDFDLLKKAEHHFTNFVKKYGKTYADEEEHAYRLSVFKSNLRRAKRHQKLDPTAVHGITQYSDLTLMEFKRNFLGGGGGGFGVKRVKHLENNVGGKATILPTNNLPADFDWRDRGVVTSVKDQGDCGASYAFSVLGAIEGAHILSTGKSFDLSEQEIIDCTYKRYSDGLNYGCNGGGIVHVFEHVRTYGFVTEAKYPYFSGQTRSLGTCRSSKNSTIGRVANFSVVNSVNEDQIAANLVKNGPLAVVMKMNGLFFSTYVGGVSCPLICPPRLRGHGVVLVGYGAGAYSPTRLKKEPYWILKNSWGTSFGENGYFRICKGNNDGACGGMDYVYTVSTTSS